MSQKVLVFTQNKALSTALHDGLRKKGFDVSVTGIRKKVLDWIVLRRPDFLFLDGLDALQEQMDFSAELRRLDGDVHILLGTPTRQSVDHADACVAAPFTVRKVHGQMRALLQADARRIIVVGDVELDARNRIVRCLGREAHLTPKEARLLRLLLERAGGVVSHAEIMREVWDTEYLGDTRTIGVHVRWLRRKIEPMSSQPTHIITVRGRGYQFDSQGSPADNAGAESPEHTEDLPLFLTLREESPDAPSIHADAAAKDAQ